MEQLPTYWYNTKAFWIGIMSLNSGVHHLITAIRLSTLGDEAAAQVVLSHASILLGPTTPHSPSPSREATEGLLRARVPPLCHHLAYRVCRPRLPFQWRLMGYRRWSYLVNMNLIGNAVFLSMDLPDTALAVSLTSRYFQESCN